MIRLVLVDDQTLIRRGLKALLKTDSNLDIVGEAENGQEAIALVEQLQPDVVLMDVRMPVMDGIAATREICQRFSTSKVLVLTTFEDHDYVVQMLQAGASGYLLKDTPFEELVQGICLVHKGYTQIGPGLANKVLGQLPTPAQPTSEWETLTPRELEVLGLIAQGASNKEIANTLFISEKTVKNHITNILSQLNLRDRTQLAIMALQRGIIHQT